MKKLLIKTLLALALTPSSAFCSTKKMFAADKDVVWRALLIALSSYPLDKNNYESGEIVTSKIPEGQQWQPLYKEISTRNNYTLKFQVFEV